MGFPEFFVPVPNGEALRGHQQRAGLTSPPIRDSGLRGQRINESKNDSDSNPEIGYNIPEMGSALILMGSNRTGFLESESKSLS
jgi:hypothetical protein